MIAADNPREPTIAPSTALLSEGKKPSNARWARDAFVLTVIVAAHTLLETSRDAIFLRRVPFDRLPWMYLALAGLSVIAAFRPRVASRIAAPSLAFLLLGGAVGTLIFWLISHQARHGVYYALYLWAGVCGSTAVSYFWTAMASSLSLGQAKRAYNVIGLGGIVGGVVGSFLAKAIFAVAAPRAGLFVSAIGFGLAAIVVVLPRKAEICAPSRAVEPAGASDDSRPPEEATTESSRPGWLPMRIIAGDAYLRGIGRLALLTALALTLLDFGFKRALVERVRPESIGGVVATIALAGNLLGALAQLFLVRPAMRKLRVTGVLGVLPLLVLIGAGATAATGLAFGLVGVRLIDATLRFSFNKTAFELLYVPIADSIRARVKVILDNLTQRLGQAIASLVIVLGAAHFGSTRALALAIAVTSAAWLTQVVRLRGPHRALFQSTLDESLLDPRLGPPMLDVAGVETLVVALDSDRDDDVIAAIDVLDERGRARLVPRLILRHPSDRVVERALDLFEETHRRDAASAVYAIVEDRGVEAKGVEAKRGEGRDTELVAHALRAAAAIDFDEARVRAIVDRVSPALRAAAYVELGARGKLTDVEQTHAHETMRAGGPIAQRAFLHALRATPSAELMRRALPLIESNDLEVRRDVARALVGTPLPEAVPALLEMLAHRGTRGAARAALLAIGTPAVEAIDRACADASTSRSILVHLPRTLSRMSPDIAVPRLVDLMDKHGDGMVRYKALRGLGRIVANAPKTPFDRPKVERILARDVRRAEQISEWSSRFAASTSALAKASSPARQMLVQLLRERRGHAIERVFRTLAILVPREAWERIHAGLESADERVRDSSRELFDAAAPAPLRTRLLALIEDHPETPAARDSARNTSPDADEASLVGELMRDGATTMRELAAYYLEHTPTLLNAARTMGATITASTSAPSETDVRHPSRVLVSRS